MLIDRRTTLLGGIAALTIPTGIVGAAAARVRPVAAAQRAGWLDVRNFGARGDGVKIDTPALHGSVNLVGGRIDDLTLAQYHETPDPKSPEIVLLAPAGTPAAYYAEFGWVPQGAGIATPTATTRWTADGTALTPDKPLTLTWDNGQGLVFERKIAVDPDFMFTVTQSVRNTGANPVPPANSNIGCCDCRRKKLPCGPVRVTSSPTSARRVR